MRENTNQRSIRGASSLRINDVGPVGINHQCPTQEVQEGVTKTEVAYKRRGRRIFVRERDTGAQTKKKNVDLDKPDPKETKREGSGPVAPANHATASATEKTQRAPTKEADKRKGSQGGRIVWDGRKNVNFYPETVGTVFDTRVQIPTLPTRFTNVYSGHECASMMRHPSPEKRRREARKNLKLAKVYDSVGINLGRLPVKVELIEVTERGTVKIRVKDSENLKCFEDMNRHTNFSFAWMKTQGYHARIDKDDVSKGLVVFTRPHKAKETIIRAQVTEFDERIVVLYGVDDNCVYKVPYDRVFYAHKNLTYDAPFQVQEFSLIGVPNYDTGGKWPASISTWIMKAMKGKNPSSCCIKMDAVKDIRLYDFILTKLQEKSNQVEIFLPREIAPNLSLNKLAAIVCEFAEGKSIPD